jgi:hypothetical protein
MATIDSSWQPPKRVSVTMSIQDALTRSQPEGIGALREAMLAPIPFLLIELGLRRLRLGSSDCDGPESSICGPVDPNVPRSPPDRNLKRGATLVLVPPSARMRQSALARMSHSRFLRKVSGTSVLMNIWIWNFRNRPELKVLIRLPDPRRQCSTLDMIVLVLRNSMCGTGVVILMFEKWWRATCAGDRFRN